MSGPRRAVENAEVPRALSINSPEADRQSMRHISESGISASGRHFPHGGGCFLMVIVLNLELIYNR